MENTINNFMTDHKEIEVWLLKFGISNFDISEDNLVNCNGDVDLSHKEITSIPVKFNIVKGNFSCSFTPLTSLAGCPTHVYRSFSCTRTKITSLEHCPKITGEYFDCMNTSTLISFENIDDFIDHIGIALIFDAKFLKTGGISLLLIPGMPTFIGEPVISMNKSRGVKALAIIHEHWMSQQVVNTKVFNCQEELMEKGYDDYALL